MATTVFRPSARALITGGASGIGLAVAKLCLSHGMYVSIVDSNPDTLDLARDALKRGDASSSANANANGSAAKGTSKGHLQCLMADVGSEEDWKSVRSEVGVVDFLMLNAGVGGTGKWGDGEYFKRVSASSFLRFRPMKRFDWSVGRCIEY